MLDALGLKKQDELFCDVPVEARIKEPFTLPEALSEYDLKKVMQNLAGRNISASDAVCFLGAGMYDHFVPSIVNRLTANIGTVMNGDGNVAANNGALQVIHECQKYISNLCCMENVDLSYASIADALDVAVGDAVAEGKKRVVVLRSVNPEYKKALKFICDACGAELCEAECSDGTTSKDELAKVLDGDTALVVAQNPNYFGIIEDMTLYSGLAHESGARLAAVVDPISLAILKAPGEYCADYALGSGQPLGGTLSFGTPGFAFMASDARKEVLEGIVTKCDDGYCMGKKCVCKTNFVSVYAAAVYLAFMGDGIAQVAKTCYSNAYYTYEKLTASSAFKAVFNKPFFREFAVKATKKNVNDINNRMLDYGMIGGPALKSEYPEYGNAWLVAVTEKRSADEVELFVKEASRSI